MRILRRIGIAVAAVLVVLTVAVTGVYLWQGPLLLTGTGYAAHNACAVELVTGRDDPAAGVGRLSRVRLQPVRPRFLR